jgi:hypothetical protein
MDLKECVEIGYKSTAISYGCARNKWSIVKELKKDAYNEQMSYEVGSDDYMYWQSIKNRWADLSTRVSWMWHFCSVGFGSGIGVRGLLEQVYTLLGEDISNLVDFDSYDNLRILSPPTFTEVPPESVVALEEEFEDEDDVFRNGSDVELQYTTIFNYLLLDVYRLMAMGLWLDNQLDRDTVIGEDADLILSIWDTVIEGSRNFLFQARNCFADTEISAKMHFENASPEDIRFTHMTRAKYFKTPEYSLTAAGGLYKVNYDKLPEEWKDKVETLDLQYLRGS